MIRVKQFGSLENLEDFVNDIVIGRLPINVANGANVRNKTLVFTTPNTTVTFPDTEDFEHAKPNQIVSQINSQLSTVSAGLRFTMSGYLIALIKEADVITGGTAASILGLPTSSTTVGSSKIILSKIASVSPDTLTKRYILVYES